jgi:hypothetical protein
MPGRAHLRQGGEARTSPLLVFRLIFFGEDRGLDDVQAVFDLLS